MSPTTARRSIVAGVGAVILGLVVGGVTATNTEPSAPATVPASVTPAVTTPPPITESPSAPTNVSNKVVVIFGENATRSTVEKGAPELLKLGKAYAYATDFQALTNAASQKDYVGLVTGDKDSVKSNARQITKDPDILNAIASSGKRKVTVYRDGMGSDECRLSNGSRSSKVVLRHDPWPSVISTAAKRANCERNDVAATALTGKGRADIPNGKLPNVGLIVPDNCQNGHDNCADGLSKVGQFQKYALQRVKELQSGPDWKSGQLTIIVTYDEGSGSSENILFAVLHPSLRGSKKVVTSSPDLTLYSLGGFLAEHGHVAKVKAQRTAPSVAQKFGLKVA